MSEYVVFWRPPGYRPVSDKAIESLCSGDSEPALSAMREQALIVLVDDHQAEAIK